MVDRTKGRVKLSGQKRVPYYCTMISSRKTASITLDRQVHGFHTWNTVENIDNDDNKDKIDGATECDGRSDDRVTEEIIY